jgi:hypothetical protein
MIRSFLCLLRGRGSSGQAQTQAGAKQYAKQSANLSFEIVETSGDDALVKWEELKTAGRGAPVVVNDLEILRPFRPIPVSDTLAAAETMSFTEDFLKQLGAEREAAVAALSKIGPKSGSVVLSHDRRAGGYCVPTFLQRVRLVAQGARMPRWMAAQPVTTIRIAVTNAPAT